MPHKFLQQDRPVPELVAATGSGFLGGFTLFQVIFSRCSCLLPFSQLVDVQRDLPVRTNRKLHVIGGARGLWSLSIRRLVKASGISYKKPVDPFQAENDSLIIVLTSTLLPDSLGFEFPRHFPCSAS